MSDGLEVLDDASAFDRLEADWRTLGAASLRPSVFLDVDWHRIWWQVYAGIEDRLHIVTLRENGRLVALLPMYTKRSSFWKGTSLLFIGTGEAREDEVATEYADVLLAAEEDDAVTQARLALIVSHLTSYAGWRSVSLRCQLSDALMLVAVQKQVPVSRRLERPAGLRYRVDLREGEAGHLQRLGASRTKRLSRSRRAANKAGSLLREQTTPADVEHALVELARLSRERHGSRETRSVFESIRFRRFHRLLAERWIPTGQAQLSLYRIGGELVAAVYAFRCRESLHYYQSGFADAAANRYMPLALAHLDEMAIARERGLIWYDLMRGQPPCYKDDFGCETSQMIDLHLFASAGAQHRFRIRRHLRAELVSLLARLNIRRR